MLPGELLMDDVRNCELAAGQCAFWWLGQQGFLIRLGKTVVCVDPFISFTSGRRVPPLLTEHDFKTVSVVLGSHDHLDHIDRGVWPAIACEVQQVRFIVPDLLRERLAYEMGIPLTRLLGLDDGWELDLGDITVFGVAAAHEFHDQDPISGRFPYLGFVLKGNGCTLYHAGDTCVYEGLVARLARYRPDVVFLPINGRDARRLRAGCIGNMTYQEAADLAGVLRPRLTVPAHFGMFDYNSEDPELFREYMEVKYPDLRVYVPEHGVRHVVNCVAGP